MTTLLELLALMVFGGSLGVVAYHVYDAVEAWLTKRS
jgi:hypothetical protein